MDATMAVVWDGSLSVGHAGIDADHEHLVHLLGRVEDAVLNKTDLPVGQVFVELADYAMSHFQREEQYMQRHHFPGLAEHKRMHDNLLAELGQLVDRAEINEQSLDQSVLEFLRHWVADHIVTWDMELARYLGTHADYADGAATEALKA